MGTEQAPEDWWETGGFPDDGTKATEPQLKMLKAVGRKLEKLLSKEEKVFIQIQGGAQEWLSTLTKVQACSIITRLVAEDDEQKKAQNKIRDRLAAEFGVPADKVVGQCGSCDGPLVQGTDTEGNVARCHKCGSLRGFASPLRRTGVFDG